MDGQLQQAGTSLQIIPEHSKVAGGRQATIIIEGDTIQQLQSAQARNLVLEYAASQFGLSKVGISGSGGVYPTNAVRADGSIDESIMMKAAEPNARYRLDYTVTAGL